MAKKLTTVSGLEYVLLAIIITVMSVIWLTIGKEAAFTFIFGNVFGFGLYRILTARSHFMMNRFRYVLRQYAGINAAIGDQAREVLREEEEDNR